MWQIIDDQGRLWTNVQQTLGRDLGLPSSSDVVEILVRMKAARQVGRPELAQTLRELLDSPQLRLEMGFRGRETVRRQQGSTARTADILLAMFAGHG